MNPNNRRRVFVTGMSLASPLGSTVTEFSERMFAGESGIQDIRGRAVPSNFPVPYAGLIQSLDFPDLHDNQYFLEIENLLRHFVAQLKPSLEGLSHLDALLFGSNFHMAEWGTAISSFSKKGFDFQKWSQSPSPLSFLADLFRNNKIQIDDRSLIGIQGTCITGNTAIGRAMNMIRSGRWNRVAVGVCEPRIRSTVLMPLYLLGALCEKEFPEARASRPFDLHRCGFVKSEGGGFLILESEDSLNFRKAEPWAEILGFSQTSDAWRLTDEREDLLGAEKALRSVLKDAALNPSQIDYINAHGTSTPMNDQIETAVIKKVFADRSYQIPVSALKSQVGHLNMACGIVEAIATVLMLKNQRIAPTLNYTDPDPVCDLDYVPNKSRPAHLKYAISNSFGFGGYNSCLALGAL